MKILVTGDTHGDNRLILELILEEKPDRIIHLGDYTKDGEILFKALDIPINIVRGNGDFESSYPLEELLEISGKKIFFTHGHSYKVKAGIDRIYYRALELGSHIALFGHTHIPLLVEEENLCIMNPGSPSLPRSLDRKKTYGIINIGEEISCQIKKIKD